MKTSTDKKIEILPEEWRAAELVKRVRKLRWIGLEQEAAKLQRASAFFSPAERAIFFATHATVIECRSLKRHD
jgi:hypothetical protein